MGRRFEWQAILLTVLMVCFVTGASGQDASPQKIADGVWFLVGDSSKGYSNTARILMLFTLN
jgi:hypothetical protein